ncbi:hypothetical protein AB0B54_30290 [Microbispora bryophytorum]|uniref:hypothetical protein n=1 Tax=Microbispora bryophytorum TaxID=1460882 RepID=UPI0033C29C1E
MDDALDLLEVLIATKLLARAERESAREKMKTLPRVDRASAKLAAAVQALIEATSEQVDTGTGSKRWCRARSWPRRSRPSWSWHRRWIWTPMRRGGLSR